ncbi:D-alanyl-D-alanine carboxypeptidase/D-alanyl-D-alanine endopeptidase [Loktanella sp. DJP18]|uniref:D-alanyl-D-alanine carboxypeptidase/D-alanyl-D-alanine endopeptidase n=1 Tax=Loktanella sp. DJP18 TaxID=3409788 RepID=UPI003BB6BE78
MPTGVRPVVRKSAVDLIAAAGLTGQVGFVIADTATGEVLETVDGATGRPPASVTKALTALYGLEVLGPDHRFATRVLATGPVVDGELDGDLILAGGGDPTLLTDDLADLVQSVAATGLKRVKGRFLVWGNAVPGVKEIEPGQLDQLDYNPSLGGLNLNFNRVFFEWARNGADYTVSLDARSETRRPVVKVARMRVVDRGTPVYTYAEGANVDEWTVAKGALGKAGSRWLPVRFPTLYAGEVFRTLAQDAGITLPGAVEVQDQPEARELARFESAPLHDMLRGMMLYSTNLTAEAVGMAATAARIGAPRGLRTSALNMADWIGDRAGVVSRLSDHSGLSDENSISAAAMVDLLNAEAVKGQLQPLMKSVVMVDGERRAIPNFPAEVRAKTGTLNFVSALAGYIVTDTGRSLSFAIFAYDPAAREESLSSQDEQPPGAAGFNGKAKGLQQDLLQRWAVLGRISG